MKYKIYAGLKGGFGGATYQSTEDFDSEENASFYAWEAACEEYESYAGLHGLRDIDEIMEEDEVDYDEAVYIMEEERESWLDYWVEEVKNDSKDV